MRHAPVIALLLVLCACTTPEPRIVTKTVEVAVPVKCAPKITQPAGYLMSREEVAQALSRAPNVTEKARIVSDQLLLWLGYGPQLEAGIKACAG